MVWAGVQGDGSVELDHSDSESYSSTSDSELKQIYRSSISDFIAEEVCPTFYESHGICVG